MNHIKRFPYREIEFTKEGRIHKDRQVREAIGMVADENITDLIFISHGWNNNTTVARSLYEELLGHADHLLSQGRYPEVAARKLGVVGALWPSMKFTDEELQPGGGAQVGPGIENELREQINAIEEYSAATNARELADEARNLIPKVDQSEEAAGRYVEIVSQLLSDVPDEAAATEDDPDGMASLSGKELVEQVNAIELQSDVDGGDYVGGAAGLGDWLSGLGRAAQRTGNTLTYFQMKKRAGIVGENGAFDAISQIKDSSPGLRVHLVGHSFGGRLVASVAKRAADRGKTIADTALLLQAAFSHNGFSPNYHDGKAGYFRPVIDSKSVARRIAITFSQHDKANEKPYAIASRLHREDGAGGVGDANDRFGSIGRNGAVKTPEAKSLSMLPHDRDHTFPDSYLLNLDGRDFISDHGDVRNLAAANLLLSVIR